MPLKNIVALEPKTTAPYGTYKGTLFNDCNASGIRSICLRWCDFNGYVLICGMEIHHVDGRIFVCGGRGQHASKATYTVPEGQRITKVHFRTGWYLDAIRFQLDNGQISKHFGGTGGTPHCIEAPVNQCFIGFHGSVFQGAISSIGMRFAVCNDSPKPPKRRRVA